MFGLSAANAGGAVIKHVSIKMLVFIGIRSPSETVRFTSFEWLFVCCLFVIGCNSGGLNGRLSAINSLVKSLMMVTPRASVRLESQTGDVKESRVFSG